MALPPGITPKTVTVGIASFFDGTLAEGTATITAPVNVVHTPSNRPIFSSQIAKRFVDGEASFDLAPTDAPGLNRVDWTYKLNVVINGALVQPDPIYFVLPEAGPDTIDLDALVAVPSSAGTPVSVAVLTAEDLPDYMADVAADEASAFSVAQRAAFVAPGALLAKRPVIFDTDWWTDVDDAVAVRHLCHAERLGLVDIRAALIDTRLAKGPGSLAAMFQYEARAGVPIGVHPSYVPAGGTPPYQSSMFDNWSHPAYGYASTTPAALTVFRQALADAADGAVDIISAGYLTNLSALLASPADSISAMTGAQLAAAKVRRLWVMGGTWPSGSENNFNRDTTAAAAASAVVSGWPTPITFLGYEVGVTVLTGANLAGTTATDPLAAALNDHGSLTTGRPSWDPMLVWLAAIGDPALLGYTTVQGTAAVNSTSGANTWTNSSSGPHRYVVKAADSDRWHQADLNARLVPGSILPVRPYPTYKAKAPVTTGSLAANLLVHMHADDLSDLANAAAVSWAADRMGKAAFQQTSSGNRPTVTTVGGLRAITFAGGQFMATPTLTTGADLTAYARVYFPTAPTSVQTIAAIVGTVAANGAPQSFYLRANASGNGEGVGFATGPDAGFVDAAGTVGSATWKTVAVRINATSVETFVDGVSNGSTAITAGTRPEILQQLVLGSRRSNGLVDPLTASVRELRLYGVRHDDTAVAAVTAAMAA